MSAFSHIFLTIGAYPAEHKVITVNYKSVRIAYAFLKFAHIRHIHVKQFAALVAADVVMLFHYMVEPVRPAGVVYLSYLSAIRKVFEISVNRSAADARMLFSHFFVYFFNRGVAMKTVDCFER